MPMNRQIDASVTQVMDEVYEAAGAPRVRIVTIS